MNENLFYIRYCFKIKIMVVNYSLYPKITLCKMVHLVFPLGYFAIGYSRRGLIYKIEDCNFLLTFTSPSLTHSKHSDNNISMVFNPLKSTAYFYATRFNIQAFYVLLI